MRLLKFLPKDCGRYNSPNIPEAIKIKKHCGDSMKNEAVTRGADRRHPIPAIVSLFHCAEFGDKLTHQSANRPPTIFPTAEPASGIQLK